jgi:signal transduction histidine kinase
MRTPLQAITGFTELLATLDLDADRRAEALDHISTGAAHLLELVDETLDLSRIEAGALPLKLEPVDIEPLIADVLDFLAPLASQHRVELANGTAVGAVLADRRRLRQVLINLVSNGIRYGGHGSTVTVSASPGLAGDKRAQIVVIDDGPGIDPALWDRLFEPFAGDGTGLGLMLAQGLVEAMGGSLTLADGTDGSGTSATVELRFVELGPAELGPAEGG